MIPVKKKPNTLHCKFCGMYKILIVSHIRFYSELANNLFSTLAKHNPCVYFPSLRKAFKKLLVDAVKYQKPILVEHATLQTNCIEF